MVLRVESIESSKDTVHPVTVSILMPSCEDDDDDDDDDNLQNTDAIFFAGAGMLTAFTV